MTEKQIEEITMEAIKIMRDYPEKKDKKVKDGLYLFYVKDEQIYPIAVSEENWDMLQLLGNAIAGNPIKVIDKPMGYVERLK